MSTKPGGLHYTGFKHTGNPAGYTETIAGVETYISKPPAKQPTTPSLIASKADKIIFFFSDVYGPLYIENQLVQDYFASFGFVVAGIDYFADEPVKNYTSKPDWDETKAGWFARAKQRAVDLLPGWTEAIKAKFGKPGTKYHAVGYSFGGPYVMSLGATGSIHSGTIVHPDFLEETHFEKIKVPLLLSCPERDNTFPLDQRRRAEDILIKRKHDYYIQVFSGVYHGFAIRGDPNVEKERWAKEQSALGVVTWFERFSNLN